MSRAGLGDVVVAYVTVVVTQSHPGLAGREHSGTGGRPSAAGLDWIHPESLASDGA